MRQHGLVWVWLLSPGCMLCFLLIHAHASGRMTLEAIKYDKGRLEILNQLLLPAQSVYERITSVQEAWKAIRSMKVG